MVDQKMIIGNDEAKLQLTKFESLSGEVSIACIRGQPRMGYEITFEVELTGIEGTYLDGMKCNLKIEELCDDGSEPADFKISMTTMLDTNQGAVAKEVVGYDNDCDIFCKEFRKLLNQYPQNQ